MKLMPLKYELLGLAVLYVVWTIYKAVKGWIDRRKEFDILLDECRAEWRTRHTSSAFPPPNGNRSQVERAQLNSPKSSEIVL